jgi:NAD(P)-dependent dehydrogenase (short-subunit alcohol dehydrogenase family)
MNELKDRVAVVTGAGRGIGQGIAIAMGKAGAKIVVASRSAPTVVAVTTDIRDAGGEATGITVDVGNRAQVYALIDQAVKAYGSVDILVNNAQGFGTEDKPQGCTVMGPLEEIDEAEMEYSYRTGLLGSFWAMRAAFPYLKARGGTIINFGSTAGEIGHAGSTSYNITKGAIRALTKTAAREWGKHNITVHIVNPMLGTDAFRNFEQGYPDEFNQLVRGIPLGRLGDVKEAGSLAVFLAGDGARYLTGMTFYVDGGHYEGR